MNRSQPFIECLNFRDMANRPRLVIGRLKRVEGRNRPVSVESQQEAIQWTANEMWTWSPAKGDEPGSTLAISTGVGNWVDGLGFIPFSCFQSNKLLLPWYFIFTDLLNPCLEMRWLGGNSRLFVEIRVFSLKSQSPYWWKGVFSRKQFLKETINHFDKEPVLFNEKLNFV